jgi:hypothetical protein
MIIHDYSWSAFLHVYSNSGKNRKGDLQDAAAMIGKQGMIMIIAETLETVGRTRPIGVPGCTPSLAQVWLVVWAVVWAEAWVEALA